MYTHAYIHVYHNIERLNKYSQWSGNIKIIELEVSDCHATVGKISEKTVGINDSKLTKIFNAPCSFSIITKRKCLCTDAKKTFDWYRNKCARYKIIGN